MPTLSTNGIVVHFLDEGQGPPLVWVPGENEHAAMALRAHERLLDRYRIIAVDPRGQGGTVAFATAASFEPSLLADDLRGLLDGLGVEQAVVGGHARGARSALELARAYPRRAMAVVAVAPPAEGADDRRREFYQQAAAKLRREGLEPFLKRLPTAPRDPQRRAKWEAHLRVAGPEALAAQYETLASLRPLTEDTAVLTMPVLVMCGEHDRLLDNARALAGSLPSGRLAVIPGAGQVPFAEAKYAYIDTLASFLSEVTRGA